MFVCRSFLKQEQPKIVRNWGHLKILLQVIAIISQRSLQVFQDVNCVENSWQRLRNYFVVFQSGHFRKIGSFLFTFVRII